MKIANIVWVDGPFLPITATYKLNENNRSDKYVHHAVECMPSGEST